MKTNLSLGVFLIVFLSHFKCSIAQDSLSVDILKPFCHSFIVEKNEMKGNGASFLMDKLSRAQFVMLGEFHGSKNISEFTEALIPQLDTCGYEHLVLEVGPNTGSYLNSLPSDKPSIVSSLKNLNTKYLRTDGKYDDTPIPFFSNVEDAEFLGEAKENKWKIIGIDQEFINGFIWQFDCMFGNLTADRQRLYQKKHLAVQDTLKRMFAEDDMKNISCVAALENSKFIQDYLDLMKGEPKNVPLVEAFRKSNEIYHMNHIKRWYDNNGTRIKYMKERLRLGLEAEEFDISKDKLLIKMGAYHLSKGFSPLSFYEVGNTLNEIAEYHGNEAVSIGFMNRYEMTEKGIEDALDLDNRYYQNLRNYYAMGSREEWIIIDLQPLREGFYYHPQKFILNRYEEKMLERFDILIITPTEYPALKNY